jgi:hypothetical protein
LLRFKVTGKAGTILGDAGVRVKSRVRGVAVAAPAAFREPVNVPAASNTSEPIGVAAAADES